MTNAQFQQAVLERFMSLDTFQKTVLEHFKAIDGRFDDLEGKVDFLAVRLFNVEERLEQGATKSELAAFRGETLFRFDGLAKNQVRFDQELVAIIDRQDRLEGIRS